MISAISGFYQITDHQQFYVYKNTLLAAEDWLKPPFLCNIKSMS